MINSCDGCRFKETLTSGRLVCVNPKVKNPADEFELLSWAAIICGGRTGERIFFKPGPPAANGTSSESLTK